MRKKNLWLFALAMVLSLASCSDKDNPVADNPTVEDLAEATVIWYGTGGGNVDAAIMNNFRQFYRAQPGSYDRVNIVAQYKVRDGKMSGREITYIRSEFSEGGSGDAGDVLASFIKQYYPDMTSLPREILLPVNIEDKELLEEYLDTVNSANAEDGSDKQRRTVRTVTKT